MRELLDYLEQAVAEQASDLFIVAGGPVSVKSEGRLRPISGEKVFPAETERLIMGLYNMADRSMDAYRATGDDDFSFSVSVK